LDILKSGGLIHSCKFFFVNWQKAFWSVSIFFSKCLNNAEVPESVKETEG